MELEASGSQSSEPEASGSQSSEPEASGRQSSEPEASGSQSSKPEASGSQSSKPEASGRQSSEPEASGSQSSEPEASGSQSSEDGSADALPKHSMRRFSFTNKGSNGTDSDDDSEDADEMTVFISEVLHPDYGMYTWPCAPVLAQYVYYHRKKFNGKKVLELAAGTALPGIVAAKCGAKVTLTDAAQYPQCLENCRRSLEANGLIDGQVDICSLTWGTIEPNLLELKGLDYVLVSDCFYDPKDFEDILMTIAFILERNSGCKCFCTYQVRSSNWNIEDLMDFWDLQCKHIFRTTFNADKTDLAGSNLPGRHSIQMLKFTRLIK